MSNIFPPSAGGSGGGVTPEDLASLIEDGELDASQVAQTAAIGTAVAAARDTLMTEVQAGNVGVQSIVTVNVNAARDNVKSHITTLAGQRPVANVFDWLGSTPPAGCTFLDGLTVGNYLQGSDATDAVLGGTPASYTEGTSSEASLRPMSPSGKHYKQCATGFAAIKPSWGQLDFYCDGLVSGRPSASINVPGGFTFVSFVERIGPNELVVAYRTDAGTCYVASAQRPAEVADQWTIGTPVAVPAPDLVDWPESSAAPLASDSSKLLWVSRYAAKLINRSTFETTNVDAPVDGLWAAGSTDNTNGPIVQCPTGGRLLYHSSEAGWRRVDVDVVDGALALSNESATATTDLAAMAFWVGTTAYIHSRGALWRLTAASSEWEQVAGMHPLFQPLQGTPWCIAPAADFLNAPSQLLFLHRGPPADWAFPVAFGFATVNYGALLGSFVRKAYRLPA